MRGGAPSPVTSFSSPLHHRFVLLRPIICPLLGRGVVAMRRLLDSALLCVAGPGRQGRSELQLQNQSQGAN
uniref:Uncharacterized protein n=1 Tax=Oryza glumipatula TaxID=40148 RepID=A0A0E0B8H5_9ORYZ